MSPVHYCSLKHLVIILTIIIIKTTIVSCAPSYSSFTQINEIADKISADLKKLSREQLCTNVLQNTYSNDAKYISNNVNGTRILEDMAAHVATTIEQKLLTPLINLKNKLEDQYNTNFDFIDKKAKEMYVKEGRDAIWTIDLCQDFNDHEARYNDAFYSSVDPKHSCANLPWYTEIYPQKTDDIFSSHLNLLRFEAACKEAKLDEVFKENFETAKTIKWQYVSSTSGYHRRYPARRDRILGISTGRNFTPTFRVLIFALTLLVLPTIIFHIWWIYFIKDYYGIILIGKSENGKRLMKMPSRELREMTNEQKTFKLKKETFKVRGDRDHEREEENENDDETLAEEDLVHFQSETIETGQLYEKRAMAWIALLLFWLDYVPFTLALLVGFRRDITEDGEFIDANGSNNFGQEMSGGLIAVIVFWALSIFSLFYISTFVIFPQINKVVLDKNNDDGDDEATTGGRGLGKKCTAYWLVGFALPLLLMWVWLYFLTDIPAYDPRTRPWYVKAAGEPKDIVIIIDSSGSMLEYDRMKYAKKAAKQVLKTLNDDDRVAVISFSDVVHFPTTGPRNCRVDLCDNSDCCGVTTCNNNKDYKAFKLEDARHCRGRGDAYLCCLEDPNSLENKLWKSKLESDPFDYVCTAGARKTIDYRGSIEEGTRNLAPANHHNKEFLNHFIETIAPNGKTNYHAAFTTAFEYLNSRKTLSSRKSAIIFLTDGAPTLPKTGKEGVTENFEQVEALIEKLSGEMATPPDLFNFLLGAGVEEYQSEISDMSVIKPVFVKDENFGDLMSKMGTYYETGNYLYESQQGNKGVRLTLPYFDFSGLGVVITAAVPMYMNKGVSKNETFILQDQERYFGVAGIDLAVADIFKDLADAKNHGKKSFGFLIDFSGRVLYHPSLPSPEDKNGKNPKFVDIKDLMILQSCDGIASSWNSSKGVDQTFIDEIRNSMTAGGSGSKYVKMQMLMPRGTSAEGATHLTFCANIYWKKVDKVEFSVAFVLEDQDAKIRVIEPGSVTNAQTKLSKDYKDWYHRVDVVPTPNTYFDSGFPTCEGYYTQTNVTFEESVWKLASSAYRDPYLYIQQGDLDRGHSIKESVDRVTRYNDLINSDELDARLDFEKMVRPRVLEDVFLTRSVEKCWKERPGLGTSVIAKYFGTTNGVFRKLTGAPESRFYDPRKRPWYMRSVEYPTWTCLSTYIDTFSKKPCSTLSVAVLSDENKTVAGVAGLDFSVETLKSIFDKAVWGGQQYKPDSSQYYVVDLSGALIYHPEIEKFKALLGDTGSPTIGKLEKCVARSLNWGNSFCKDLSTMEFLETSQIAEQMIVKNEKRDGLIAKRIPGSNAILIIQDKAKHESSEDSCKIDDEEDPPHNSYHCADPPCARMEKIDTCTNEIFPFNECLYGRKCSDDNSYATLIHYKYKNPITEQDETRFTTRTNFRCQEPVHSCYAQSLKAGNVSNSNKILAGICPQPVPSSGNFKSEMDIWYFPCIPWWVYFIVFIVLVIIYAISMCCFVRDGKGKLMHQIKLLSLVIFSPILLCLFLLQSCMVIVIWLSPVEYDAWRNEIMNKKAHLIIKPEEKIGDWFWKYVFGTTAYFCEALAHIFLIPSYIFFISLILITSIYDTDNYFEFVKNYKNAKDMDREDKLFKFVWTHGLIALRRFLIFIFFPAIAAYFIVIGVCLLLLAVTNPIYFNYNWYREDSTFGALRNKNWMEPTVGWVLIFFIFPAMLFINIAQDLVILVSVPLAFVTPFLNPWHFGNIIFILDMKYNRFTFNERLFAVISRFLFSLIDFIIFVLYLPLLIIFASFSLVWIPIEIIMLVYTCILGKEEYSEVSKEQSFWFGRDNNDKNATNTNAETQVVGIELKSKDVFNTTANDEDEKTKAISVDTKLTDAKIADAKKVEEGKDILVLNFKPYTKSITDDEIIEVYIKNGYNRTKTLSEIKKTHVNMLTMPLFIGKCNEWLTLNFYAWFVLIPKMFCASVIFDIAIVAWCVVQIVLHVVGAVLFISILIPSPGEVVYYFFGPNEHITWKYCYDELVEEGKKPGYEPYSLALPFTRLSIIVKYFLETYFLQWLWMPVEFVFLIVLIATSPLHVEFKRCLEKLFSKESSRMEKMYIIIPQCFIVAMYVFTWRIIRSIMLVVVFIHIGSYFFLEVILFLLAQVFDFIGRFLSLGILSNSIRISNQENKQEVEDDIEDLTKAIYKLVNGTEKRNKKIIFVKPKRDKKTLNKEKMEKEPTNTDEEKIEETMGMEIIRKQSTFEIRKQYTEHIYRWFERVTDVRLYSIVPIYFLNSTSRLLLVILSWIPVSCMCIFNVISGLIVCLGPYRMELVNKLKRKNLSNSHRYMFSAVEYLFVTIIFFAFVLPCQLLMLVVIFLSFYRIPRLCKNLFCDPGTTLYQKWIIRFGVIGSEFASIMKDIYNVMIKYKAAVAKEGPKGLKNAGACFKLYVFDTIVAMVISLIGILCFILALTCVVVSFVIEIAMAIVIACTIFNLMEFIDDVEDHFFENNNKPSLLFVTSTTIRRTVFGPKDSDHETIDIEDGTETDEEKKIEENDNEGKGDNAKSSENELAAQTNILRKLTKDGAAMERLLAMEILPRERVQKIFLASGKDEGKAFDDMIRVALLTWFEFYGNLFYIITLNFLAGVFSFIAFLVLSPLWLLTIIMLFTTWCGRLFWSKAWKQLFIEEGHYQLKR